MSEENVFIPVVSVAPAKTFPCGLNQKSYELTQALIHYLSQERPVIICDEKLVKAAQAHAEDMARNDYLEHENLYGMTPNERVREAGYALPDFYVGRGNNLESIAGGTETAQETLELLVNSTDHVDHILGRTEFYRSQKHIGVGYYATKPHDSAYWFYWVVLMAH